MMVVLSIIIMFLRILVLLFVIFVYELVYGFVVYLQGDDLLKR